MAMLCQICKKNTATIHYKSSINGQVNEKYLCSECAAKSEFGEKAKNSDMFNTIDMVDSFFDNTSDTLLGGLFGEILSPKTGQSPAGKVCSGCGMRYNDFVHGGKLGCEKCYETFDALLKPTLVRIHGNTRYCGKMPFGYEKKESKADKIKRLQEKLAKAVQAQEYEMAAQYRDEIKALENGSEDKEGEEKSNG